ncbi:MAG: hypothetical protein PHO13_07475 [Fermentimonas sp.]|jgi:hypothetical protein|nr:hypothetical protein [Fermentimonas sp.]NLC86414.1 hypothetical protein [Bacteroidales bacterium]HBT86364.1 hypothetical protein [Porphyromonadaceae bacterium]MDD2930684.1 hypothetical protein [Fermentimonas sp.]MDD3189324.1 hypothetical protein [Fermentimonas sp.]
MKKIVLFFAVIAVSAISITFSSCSNDLNLDEEKSVNELSLVEEESAVAVIAGTRAIEVPPCIDLSCLDLCGDVQEVRLIAGQHYEAGKVYVVNTSEKLYVGYVTTGDWKMEAIHLYVGACDMLPVNNAGNLVPGNFPHKVEFTELQSFYYVEIPLVSLPDGCLCVSAHAEVVRVVDNEIVQSETAFGEGEVVGNNWFMKFDYCIAVCEDEPPVEVCYQDETAWAAGTRYVTKGNWATYTPYVANTTVNVYAGQTYLVGTATFSEVVDGKVTITLAALNGARLQDVAESVKIQGYNSLPPSKNPAPGQFTTYKGTETTITVDAFAYYGIHLDVQRVVDCPE